MSHFERRDVVRSFDTKSFRAEPLQFRTIHSHPIVREEALLPEIPMPEAVISVDVDAMNAALLEMQTSFEERLLVERTQVVRMLEEFAEERRSYFQGIEEEVVRLSLAIAERVVHREIKLDPILLAGAARVALGKVSDGSGAVLRVSVEEREAWSRVMGDAQDSPKVLADANFSNGECVLETKLGKVDLGVRAQLQEIEKGFFDLLGRKPTTRN